MSPLPDRTDSSAILLAASAFHALMDSGVPLGLAVIDADFRFLRINEILASANGPPVEAHIGRTLREVLPTAADVVEPLLHEVMTGKPLRNIRIMAVVPSMPGELSEWDATYLPIPGPEGKPIGILAHAVNHSLQRRNAVLERESEQLRRVLDNLYVFVGLLSVDGVLLQVNKAPLEAAGLMQDDVCNRMVWDTWWWSFDVQKQSWLRDVVMRAAAGEVVRADVDVRMAGEALMSIDLMMAPLYDDEGRIIYLVASAMDISDRLAAQHALRDSEERYRRMFEGSTHGKAVVGGQGQVLLANESMARMFGYAAQEMVGLPVQQLVPERYRERHSGLIGSFISEPIRHVMADRRELFALRRDGSEFPAEIALNPLSEGEGERQVLVTVTDVTERHAAQQQIEGALREKTVLLNEIHHRVKNNLQVISSLLNLQARNAEPSVQAALRDSQSRVRSMALMHQLLYERADFSALDLGPYLRRLAGLLRDTYLGSSSGVRLVVEAPDTGLRMDLQRAIPCGLLVTELVTNAIKHAFPQGATGRVLVRVTMLPGEEACVDVIDDGVGMPAQEGAAGQPPRVKGLGLQLLPMLAQQCGSELQQLVPPEGERGTHFRLLLQLNSLMSPGESDV